MSWQSALACWYLRRHFRPETLKPHIDVERARALTSTRVWSPRVPAGWRLRETYRASDAPLLGEWLEPASSVPDGGFAANATPTVGARDDAYGFRNALTHANGQRC